MVSRCHYLRRNRENCTRFMNTSRFHLNIVSAAFKDLAKGTRNIHGDWNCLHGSFRSTAGETEPLNSRVVAYPEMGAAFHSNPFPSLTAHAVSRGIWILKEARPDKTCLINCQKGVQRFRSKARSSTVEQTGWNCPLSRNIDGMLITLN